MLRHVKAATNTETFNVPDVWRQHHGIWNRIKAMIFKRPVGHQIQATATERMAITWAAIMYASSYGLKSKIPIEWDKAKDCQRQKLFFVSADDAGDQHQEQLTYRHTACHGQCNTYWYLQESCYSWHSSQFRLSWKTNASYADILFLFRLMIILCALFCFRFHPCRLLASFMNVSTLVVFLRVTTRQFGMWDQTRLEPANPSELKNKFLRVTYGRAKILFYSKLGLSYVQKSQTHSWVSSRVDVTCNPTTIWRRDENQLKLCDWRNGVGSAALR